MNIRQIPWLEPVDAAERLYALGGLSFLDSAMRHERLGRYSYVAPAPFGRLVVEEGTARWNGEETGLSPLQSIAHFLALYRQESQRDLPPFQGGAIGYFSYEFGRLLERLPEPAGSIQG
ncbi:MAG: aminodeoxychorismate synthase component I, partial [Alphaproteobacteria bacterium]